MESSYLVWMAIAIIAVLALLFVLVSFFFGWGEWLRRRRNIEMSLDAGVRHLLDEYLNEFARRLGWEDESTAKLRAAGEEVLMSLAGQDGDTSGLRRLRVSVRQEKGAAVMEFLAAPQGTNFEEQIKLLEKHAVPVEQEMSLRLLTHYASSVRHRHYHLNDLVTVRVERSG
ncbi:MAG: hypothetical protein F4187_06495 [Gemmatimonadetes bacterium]|nr:hypothetical protein [Gemmatimonadota bacterium]